MITEKAFFIIIPEILVLDFAYFEVTEPYRIAVILKTEATRSEFGKIGHGFEFGFSYHLRKLRGAHVRFHDFHVVLIDREFTLIQNYPHGVPLTRWFGILGTGRNQIV